MKNTCDIRKEINKEYDKIRKLIIRTCGKIIAKQKNGIIHETKEITTFAEQSETESPDLYKTGAVSNTKF